MESRRSQRTKRTRNTPVSGEAKISGLKKAKTAASKAKAAPTSTRPAATKNKAARAKATTPVKAKTKAPVKAKATTPVKAKTTMPVKAKAAPKKASGPLKVGTDAPPFSAKDQDGANVTLESFKGNKNIVVYFYPKDNTPGCSKEACKFRDLKNEYDALDCVVLGVSADHEVSHGKFIAKFGLNFRLLADTDRSLIKSYGASKAGDKIQRSTVLVNKLGKVAAVWNPVSGAEQHPVQVLAKLKEIV